MSIFSDYKTVLLYLIANVNLMYNFDFINFFFLRFYLFIFRERGREKERVRNINRWLHLLHPPLGTQPATQACGLSRNQISDFLVHRPALNPLSHTSQGRFYYSYIFREKGREREKHRLVDSCMYPIWD